MQLSLQCAQSDCLDPLKSSEWQIIGDHSLSTRTPPPPPLPLVHTRRPEGVLKLALFGSVHHQTPPWITCRKGVMLETCRGLPIVTVLPKCGQVEQRFGWTLTLSADKVVGLSSLCPLLMCDLFSSLPTKLESSFERALDHSNQCFPFFILLIAKNKSISALYFQCKK